MTEPILHFNGLETSHHVCRKLVELGLSRLMKSIHGFFCDFTEAISAISIYVTSCLLNYFMICLGFPGNDGDLLVLTHTKMDAYGGFKEWHWAKEGQNLLTWGLS